MEEEIPDLCNPCGGGTVIPSGSLLLEAISKFTDLQIDLLTVGALIIGLTAVAMLSKSLITIFFK